MNKSLKILSSDWHAALHNALPGANPFRTFDNSNYLIGHQDNFLVILTHHHFANLWLQSHNLHISPINSQPGDYVGQ